MKKSSTVIPAKQVFSRNVLLARRVSNLSQERVAELSDLHRTYVGQIERGDVTPSLDAAERVAKALGMELWEILNPQFSIDALIGRKK